MGDRVAVMDQGVLQQVATPDELYDRPANAVRRRVHRLAADEPLLAVVTGSGDGFTASSGSRDIRALCGALHGLVERAGNGDVIVGVRPEHIELVDEGRGMRGTVRLVEHLGSESIVHVDAADLVLYNPEHAGSDADASPRVLVNLRDDVLKLRPGDTVHLHVADRHLHAFDAATGVALTALTEPARTSMTFHSAPSASRRVRVPLHDGWTLRQVRSRVRSTRAATGGRRRARLRAHRPDRRRPAPRPVPRHATKPTSPGSPTRTGATRATSWSTMRPPRTPCTSSCSTGSTPSRRPARRRGGRPRPRTCTGGTASTSRGRSARRPRARRRVPVGTLHAEHLAPPRAHWPSASFGRAVQLRAQDGVQLGLGLGPVAHAGRRVAPGGAGGVVAGPPRRRPRRTSRSPATTTRRGHGSVDGRHRRRRRRVGWRGLHLRARSLDPARCASSPTSMEQVHGRRCGAGSRSTPAPSPAGGRTRTATSRSTRSRSSCSIGSATTAAPSMRRRAGSGSARSSSTPRPTTPAPRSRSSSTADRSSCAASTGSPTTSSRPASPPSGYRERLDPGRRRRTST